MVGKSGQSYAVIRTTNFDWRGGAKLRSFHTQYLQIFPELGVDN